MTGGTINIPGLGPKPRKFVLITGAITAGIVGYAWFRHRQNAGAGTAAAAAAPAGQDPNAIDPATGLTYAQESGQAGGVYGYGYNPYGGGSGLLDSSGNPIGSPAPVPITTQQFTTNGQWAQAAEDYLVNTAGADATVVAAALGKYITGQQLTSEQQGVVSSAIAFDGYPPVAGPGGAPPAMKVATAVPIPAPVPNPHKPPPHHKPHPPHHDPPPRHITTNGTQTWDQVARHYVHRQHPIYWLDHWNPDKARKWHGTGRKLPRGMTLRVA